LCCCLISLAIGKFATMLNGNNGRERSQPLFYFHDSKHRNAFIEGLAFSAVPATREPACP
ncbi:MAG: hypothetical protein PVF89_07175, partial [Lysobacterales bacterium]